MAATIATIVFSVMIVSRSSGLFDWMHERRLEQWRTTNTFYADKRGFVDVLSRLFLDDLPRADFSTGSVCLIGSSSLVDGFHPWMLSDDDRSFVFNLGIPGATFTEQADFVRHLVDREGLLAAGGDRTMLVFCLDYENATRARRLPRGFVYGFYSYEPGTGIVPAPMSAVRRLTLHERVRCANFLNVVSRDLFITPEVRLDVRPLRVSRSHDSARYRRLTDAFMDDRGADWRVRMGAEVGRLAEAFDYLHAREVAVLVVLMPGGSWHRDEVYDSALREDLIPMCEDRSVPVVDLSELLADAEFADHAHANYAGSKKLSAALGDVFREHLDELIALR